MTYFNTTNESGATLKNNVAKAKSQEIIIKSSKDKLAQVTKN